MAGTKIGDYTNRQGNNVRIWQYGKAFHIEVLAMGRQLNEREFSAQLQVARRKMERDMAIKVDGPVSSGGSNWSRTKVYV